MRNKGFTLVELLAVIVLLGIIALMTVPNVIKTVNDAKKNSFQNSTNGIVRAVQVNYRERQLSAETLEEIIFTYSDGVEISDPYGYKLEYDGQTPQNGTIIVNEDGQIALALHNGVYCAEKGYDNKFGELKEKSLEDCEVPFSCTMDLIDARDSEVYKTVKIGNQCWMSEDLRFDCSLKGYTNVGSNNSWSGTNNCGNQGLHSFGAAVGNQTNTNKLVYQPFVTMKASQSSYNNELGYEKFVALPFDPIGDYIGLTYQWSVAMNGITTEGSQGLCPDGWHIPTDTEWSILETTVDPNGMYIDITGDRGIAGKKLKSSFFSGDDSFDFSALLAGTRENNGSIIDTDNAGSWWTSTATGSNTWSRKVEYDKDSSYRNDSLRSSGLSVRCIMNE